MGKELAQEAYAQAFENLKEQLHQTKIMVMDITVTMLGRRQQSWTRLVVN